MRCPSAAAGPQKGGSTCPPAPQACVEGGTRETKMRDETLCEQRRTCTTKEVTGEDRPTRRAHALPTSACRLRPRPPLPQRTAGSATDPAGGVRGPSSSHRPVSAHTAAACRGPLPPGVRAQPPDGRAGLRLSSRASCSGRRGGRTGVAVLGLPRGGWAASPRGRPCSRGTPSQELPALTTAVFAGTFQFRRFSTQQDTESDSFEEYLNHLLPLSSSTCGGMPHGSRDTLLTTSRDRPVASCRCLQIPMSSLQLLIK